MDDPFTTWLFPSQGLRERLVESWTRQLRVVYVPKGYAHATSGVEAVALWSPPGGYRLPAWQQLRLAPTYLRLLGLRRMSAAAAAFAMIDRAHPPERHWYLAAIGVTPSRQRQGSGTALLRPMLERADAEHTVAYLETFRAENVPYYERFGFSVTGEDDIRGGPHMWSMTRMPASRPG